MDSITNEIIQLAELVEDHQEVEKRTLPDEKITGEQQPSSAIG